MIRQQADPTAKHEKHQKNWNACKPQKARWLALDDLFWNCKFGYAA